MILFIHAKSAGTSLEPTPYLDNNAKHKEIHKLCISMGDRHAARQKMRPIPLQSPIAMNIVHKEVLMRWRFEVQIG